MTSTTSAAPDKGVERVLDWHAETNQDADHREKEPAERRLDRSIKHRY